MSTEHKLKRPYIDCRAWIKQYVPQALQNRACNILAGRPDLASELEDYFKECYNYFINTEANFQATVDGLHDALEAKNDVNVTVTNEAPYWSILIFWFIAGLTMGSATILGLLYLRIL